MKLRTHVITTGRSRLGSHEAEDARPAADLEDGLARDGGGGEGGRVGRDAGRVLQHGAVDREPGVRLQEIRTVSCGVR